MNGVRQKRLVTSLAKLATRCCSYLGDRCDCKFMADSTPESSIMTGSEAGSGCPELMMTTYMIAAMTEQEFNAISKRAGVSISQDPEETIDAAAILKEEKRLRDATFLPKAKPAIRGSKSKNTKSAYDLSHSKKAIQKMMPHLKTKVKPKVGVEYFPPKIKPIKTEAGWLPPKKSYSYDCDSCGASFGREDNLAFHQCPKR